MYTAKYSIEAKRNTADEGISLKIAVVADLHEQNPAPVLAVLRKAKPDVIAVPGDLLERRPFKSGLTELDKDSFTSLLYSLFRPIARSFDPVIRKLHGAKSENSYTFLREASKIAPVLMSYGNHELFLTKADKKVMKENHIILLNNSSVEIKGVLFGGIPSMQGRGGLDMDFLREFGKDDRYKVLLCHHPEYFSLIEPYADLVLAGHVHGGQIRINGRGLFAPGQGWLPRYHHGVFSLKQTKMVVSAGCANTSIIPRIGNPREVVICRVNDIRK